MVTIYTSRKIQKLYTHTHTKACLLQNIYGNKRIFYSMHV